MHYALCNTKARVIVLREQVSRTNIENSTSLRSLCTLDDPSNPVARLTSHGIVSPVDLATEFHKFVMQGPVLQGDRSATTLVRLGTRSTNQQQYIVRAMCSAQTPKFETLNVTRPRDMVVQVELNRPEKRNAMNKAFWREMVECFNYLDGDSECRAIVLTGAGTIFTAGLDLGDFSSLDGMSSDADVGRRAFKVRQAIKAMQESFTVIERCTKPVIAAMHSACVGGGIDMSSACDVRYCTSDAWFQIKEVDIGLAADVGTLQRFPKVVGNDSLVRELVYTARKFYADEALAIGYVSRIFPNKKVMVEGALDLAVLIASKSPIAVQGSKVSLVYSRDHGVTEGLEHIRVWNQGMLQSEDVIKSAMAAMQKQTPTFSKL